MSPGGARDAAFWITTVMVTLTCLSPTMYVSPLNTLRSLERTQIAIGKAFLLSVGPAAFPPDGIRSTETTVTERLPTSARDRKSTRLNSSHQIISYAVF